MKTLTLTLLLLTGCGRWAPEIKTASTGDVETRSSVEAEGEATIAIESTLDRVLEVCEIVDGRGNTVPFSKWTALQKDCVKMLSISGVGL